MPLRHAPDRVEAGALSAEITIHMRRRVRQTQAWACVVTASQYLAFQSERQLTFALILCAPAHISKYEEKRWGVGIGRKNGVISSFVCAGAACSLSEDASHHAMKFWK
jgi:hypothetical protein